jgi:nicotinamide riboside kinase
MAFTECATHTSVIDADAFIEYSRRFISQYDYIFYISPEGIGIKDNGVRETDTTYRKEIDESIQKLLFKYRPVYFTIKGSTEERIEQILKIIS